MSYDSRCTCNTNMGISWLDDPANRDPDCPRHGDGANTRANPACPWGAWTGGACGRARRERKQTDRECPIHDHQSLPGFQKLLRKH